MPSQPRDVRASVDNNLLIIRWEYSDESVSMFYYALRDFNNDVVIFEGSLLSAARQYKIPLSQLASGSEFDFELQAVNLLGESVLSGTKFITPIISKYNYLKYP